MIPTLEDIIRGLLDGSMDPKLAARYLDEHERLQARANQCFERLESQLRQCLREAAQQAGAAAPSAVTGVSVTSTLKMANSGQIISHRLQFTHSPALTTSGG